MPKRENKELVGYLTKEAKRLRNAIREQEEKGQYGKAEHHRQSLNAYLKFLNNINKGAKNSFLFKATILLTIFSGVITAQAQEPKLLANELLAGRIYTIEISEQGYDNAISYIKCLLSFKAGRLHVTAEEKEAAANLVLSKSSPGYFYSMQDSAQGGIILFSSQTKNKKGETWLWLGSAEGSIIKGTLIWSDGKKKYEVFSFSGKLKYTNSSEGNF